MVLTPEIFKQSISSDKMRYREGRPETRKYDACYYEIVSLEEQVRCEYYKDCDRHYISGDTF